MNERLISFPRFGRTRVLDAAAALTPLAFGWGCQPRMDSFATGAKFGDVLECFPLR